MSPFLRVWARWLIPLLLIGLAAAVVGLNLIYVDAAPARSDFVPRWEGGRAWIREQMSPYDPEVSLRAQERVYGRAANLSRGEDPQHFLYPFPSLLVFAPLGLLGLEPAQAIWVSLIEVALFVSTLLWAASAQWKWSTGMMAAMLLFSVAWYPAFAAIVGAQFAALEALLLAGALAAIRAQRNAVAGLLLAACMLKPQLGLGLVLYAAVRAIVQRREALLGWFITGFVALAGAGWLLDPSWPAGMARQVIDYLALPVSLSPLFRLADDLGIGTVGSLALTGICLLYLAWEWRDSIAGDDRRFLWTVAMTQVILLLVAPFAIAANLVTLILPLIVILEAWQVRQGRAVDAPAIVLLLLLAAATWLVSAGGLGGEEASLGLTLGVPLVMIVGLFWVRWWTTRARLWAELGGRAA